MTQTSLFNISDQDTIASGDEWYTPRWLFEAAALTFDMDVCAPTDPTFRTCPARHHLTIHDDGLTARWQGLVWVNPPYSNPAPWVNRWVKHEAGLLLVPAARNAAWRGEAFRAADAMTLIDCVFNRPDGSRTTVPYALILAARGETAGHALGRVAGCDRVARGAVMERA